MRRLFSPFLSLVPFVFFVVIALCVSSASVDAQTAREVTYTPQSVVPLHAKLRFTTMVILPEGEQILDFVCGDKEFWIVSGGQNLAYIKPAKAGASTNLNLVTASGHVYSFVLTEGSGDPDLKVFVAADDTMNSPAQLSGPQKFYSAAQVDEARRAADDARHDAEDARKQLDAAHDAAKKTIDERVNEFRATYPTELQFPYRFKANQRPFNVSAIYTDGLFTYIRSNAAELPALYEWIVDASSTPVRTPNLVNFQVEHGVFIVPKVLDSGYLVIGKQKFVFFR
jgi:type IV secretory pathway VirB9-like protein